MNGWKNGRADGYRVYFLFDNQIQEEVRLFFISICNVKIENEDIKTKIYKNESTCIIRWATQAGLFLNHVKFLL